MLDDGPYLALDRTDNAGMLRLWSDAKGQMIKFKIKIPKTPWKEFRCFFGFHKRRDNDAETFMWLPHGGGSMSRVHARTCQDCGRPYQHPEE